MSHFHIKPAAVAVGKRSGIIIEKNMHNLASYCLIKEREKHIFRFVLPVIYRFSLLQSETNFYHNTVLTTSLFSNAVKEKKILSAIIFHFIIGFSVIVAVGLWLY